MRKGSSFHRPQRVLFLILSSTLLLPGIFHWAGPVRERELRTDEVGDPIQSAQGIHPVKPELHGRPSGLSPLAGVPFDHDLRKLREEGTLFTSTGVFRVADPDNQRGIPDTLREPATEAARGAGLKPGALNYALLTGEGRRRAGAIEPWITGLGGRIVGLVRGGYLLWVPPAGMKELIDSDLFLAFSPVPRAHKIFPDVGLRPLIEKQRAESLELRLRVEVVAGLDNPAQVEKRLLAHAVSVRPLLEQFGLRGYEVVATTDQVRKLAGLPWVVSISEPHELMLQNLEAVPTMQVGSWEDRQFETPFWAAGLDGTGQIVAIADNGVSLDQPGLSDTPTDPGTVLFINFGPVKHRKFEYFFAFADDESCDSPQSGGRTHGNVVASLIAGNAVEDFGDSYLASYQPNRAEVLTGLNLDGLARGARLVFQDIGASGISGAPPQCLKNELVEVGGNVTVPANDVFTLMELAYDKGARLHVLPFAVPNLDSTQFQNCASSAPCVGAVDAGTYTAESRQVDLFLASHLEYMAFLPASNNGGVYPRPIGRIVDAVPDLFDSDLCNNNVNATFDCGGNNASTTDDGPYCASCCGGDRTACPAVIPPATSPVFMMIQAPATAKNDITVGAGRTDEGTMFGTFNAEDVVSNFTSKGPEGPSLRMGPTIVTPGHDDSDVFGAPNTRGLAVLGSRDNDQLSPVEGPDAGRNLVLDDGNTGTSYAAATATAMGAIVRQYFTDGFYPSGRADPHHGIATISGALVKAILVMMTNYIDSTLQAGGQTDRDIAENRCGTFLGGTIGVVGNNEQGCGRPILAQGLPLGNYPDTNVYPLIGPGTPEQAAAGLVVFDFVATGEPVFTGSGVEKSVQVFKPDGQLRCALAWVDPPSGFTDTAGLLINDLDLELVSPGGVSYHGNVFSGAWSRADPGPAAFDDKNPFELVQVDRPEVGFWAVRVKGTFPIGNSAPDEDANGNFRLDDGEDLDGDGILDLGGQPYALACSGPLLTPSQSFPGGGAHPGTGNLVRWDDSVYGCREDAFLRIFDNYLSFPSGVTVSESVTINVLDATGTLVETERVALRPEGGGFFLSDPVPLREETPPVAGNGLLEVGDGYLIEARYADPDSPEGVAVAAVQCRPNLLASKFSLAGQSDLQGVVSGGCDNDQSLDAGEVVTFSAAICNESNRDRYTEMTATLAVTGGPAAALVEVIEPEVRIGNLPKGSGCGVPPFGSGFQGISFSLRVDPAAQALVDTDEANGWVELTLSLQAANQDRKLETETFTFRQAVVADREFLKYSTGFPDGTAGMEVERDLDRDGVISTDADTDNVPDILDDAIDAVEERIVFDPIPRIPPRPDHTGNTCTEDTDGDGILDPGEDVGLDGVAGTADTGEGNGTLDRCIYGDPDGTSGTPDDLIPWSFDQNDGGFAVERDPVTDTGIPALGKAWENVRSGACGFQTVIADPDPSPGFQNLGAGVWKTGDGLTPDLNGDGQISPFEASAYNDVLCHNYSLPFDPDSARGTEILADVLESSIITKVNQDLDERGFPFTAEFRRLAFNINAQIADRQGRLIVDIDNDIDEQNQNVLVGENDRYTEDRAPHDLFQFHGPIDPTDHTWPQDTFGPLSDPDCSLGEDIGLDSIPASFDATECNGVLDREDSGCDQVLNAPMDPHEGNGIIEDESGCPGGGPPGGADCGCDGVIATCGALDFGEDLNFSRTFDPGEDVGCDGILAGCPAGSPGDLRNGDGAISEAEPNEGWFAGQPVTPSAEVHGKVNNYDPAGWNDSEDGYNFDTTGLGAQTVTITLEFDALDDAGDATDLDLFLISLPPLPFAIVDSALTAANPEVISAAIGAGPHQILVDSWGSVGNRGTAGYTLTVVLGNDDVGCDGVPGTADAGEGDGRISTPPDTGEGNGAPDWPPDPGEGDGIFTTEDQNGNGILDREDSNANGFLDPIIATGVLTGDESGFAGFTVNAPGFIVAVGTRGHEYDFGKLPFPEYPAGTQAGPVRNVEADIVGYEESEAVGGVFNPGLSYQPGPGGNRWRIGWEWRLREADPPANDFGVALDDVVFEWQEVHPGREGTAACDKFLADPGIDPQDPRAAFYPAGSQCASLAVDRTVLYRCEESLRITVLDPTPHEADGNGDGTPDVEVILSGGSETAGSPATGGGTRVFLNRQDPGIPGTYRGSAVVSQRFNNAGTLFLEPGTETRMDVLFPDPECDRDGDQEEGETDFADPLDDDDGDGIPDDLLLFAMTVGCQPETASISLVGTEVDSIACLGVDRILGTADDTCDRDIFADSGERVRLRVTVVNNGPEDLTGVTFGLVTADPDIACITDATAFLPHLPVGVKVTTETDTFEFIVSDAVNSVSFTDPALGNFLLTLVSDQALGTQDAVRFDLPLDLDILGSIPDRIPGPDGVKGTEDDGVLLEDFEGPHVLTTRFLPGPDNLLGTGDDFAAAALAFENTIGSIVGGSTRVPPADPGPDGIVGTDDDPVAAGNPIGTLGFDVIVCPDIVAAGRSYAGDPGCQIDDSQWNDWHLHPPNATDTQSIPFQTPLNGDQAHGGTTSLHWGKHTQAGRGQWFLDDTVSLRQIAAFVTDPINLAVDPAPGELMLSFQHIVLLMDNNRVSAVPGTSYDRGQIQISVDLDPDPTVDAFGPWQILVPFIGGYDHIASKRRFTGAYCRFSPTDGTEDILCHPNPVFSHQGNQQGPAFTTYQPQGPVSGGSVGTGQWVFSQTDLAEFLGQRVQIRWIGTTWELFQTGWDSYLEFPEGGSPFALGDDEDGWWIDEIRIAGVLESPAALSVDTKNSFQRGFGCTEDVNGNGVLDEGEDLNGNGIIDPLQRDTGRGRVVLRVEPSDLVVAGTLITANAGESDLACADSSIQFRFWRAPGSDPLPEAFTLVRDWSGLPTFQDAPEATTTYGVEIRCAPTATDPALIALEARPVASTTALVEVAGSSVSKPSTIRTLELASPGDVGGEPPIVDVTPPSLDSTLPIGGKETRVLTLSNGGSEAIAFSLTVVPSGVSFVSLNPATGAIPPAASVDVNVVFDATGLLGGIHPAAIEVSTEDPIRPRVTIPVRLTATGIPAISVLGGPLDFGSLFVGAGRDLPLVIKNRGTDLLELTSITSDTPEFTPSDTALDIGPGSARTLTVTFTPSNPIPFSGTLDIFSNDPGTPVVSISLAGGGEEPPVVGVNPPALDAELPVGGKEVRTLTISNSGSSPLDFSLRVIPSKPRFVNLNPVSGTVSPSTSVIVTVSLDATDLLGGIHEADIEVSSNDPITPAVRVPVRLTVVGAPNISVIGDPLDFGTIFVGSSRDRSIFIENSGTDLLQVSLISSDTPEFSPSPTALDITPGSFTPVTVSFTPLTAGTFNGTLNIASNDPDTPAVSISLTGVGEEPPVVGIDPTALAATLFAGNQEAQALTISNSGGGNLDFSLTVNPSGTTFLSLDPVSGSVPPSASLEVTVLLDATDLPGGVHEAGIKISSNDPFTPLVTIPVRLTVVSAPDITVVGGPLDFGTLFVGSSLDRSLLIENTGTELLQVSSIASDIPEFSPSATVLNLAPGGSATVAVTFAPVTAGTFNGTLSLTSNDPVTPVVNISLTGAGEEPPVVGVDPPALAATLFTGNQETQAFTISNSGGSNLDFSLTVNQPGTTFLSLTPASGSIPPAASLEVTVIFDATGLLSGIYEADIRISSNDPATPLLTVPVTLTVTGAPDISVTGGPLDFGTLFVGLSRELGIVITNTGTHNLEVTSIASDIPEFSPSATVLNLAPGGSATVTVTFAPVTAGTFNGTLSITSNDPGTPVVNISLTGVGEEPPVVGVDPPELASTLFTGNQESRTLTISNSGGNNLDFSLTVNPPGITFLSLAPVSGSIPPAASLEVTVIFDATGLLGGIYEADIRISSNDPVTPLLTVPVTLTVTGAPDISVVGGPLDFGTLFVGLSRELEVVIENTGTELLQATSIASNTPEFSPSPTALDLAPGSSATVTVTFTPVTAGTFNGTLSVTSNDPDTPVVNISLTGVGELPPVVGVDPPALAAALFTGNQESQAFTISNNGASTLDFSLTVAPSGTTFLSLTPGSGSLPSSASLEVMVLIDASDLLGGVHRADIRISSNDPATPLLTVPVTLTVTGAPNISIAGEPVTLESIQDFHIFGGVTRHTLPITVPPEGEGTLDLIAQGDFGQTNETATISAEGMILGSVGGIGSDCAPAIGRFPINPGALTTLAADGVVEIEVQNSPAVVPFCVVNFHTVRLHYGGPFDPLDFGPLFVGLNREMEIVIESDGTDFLQVTSIASDTPEFSPSPSVLNLSPGSLAIVTVTFTPVTAGTFTGTLSITSNDPDTPVVSISLAGVGLEPPVVSVDPPALESTLFLGDQETQSLTISNSGLNTLDFSLAVDPPGTTFLSPAPVSGSVPPSASQEVTVLFDATTLLGGIHEADIRVSTNDPITPLVTVPVRLTVVGIPDITVIGGPLDFGTLFVGLSREMEIVIENNGTDLLEVTSIASDIPEFSPSPTALNLSPGASATVTVTFTPPTATDFNGSLTVMSNDPDTPVVSISLTGVGEEPPVVGVNPPALASTLPEGEQELQILTISNTGGNPLDFSMGITAQSSSENGEFELLRPSFSGLTCVVADPVAGFLYGQNNRATTFFRYVASTDTWEEIARSPVNAGNNGGAALLGGRVYTAYTENGSVLGVYDIATDSWSTIPNPLGTGTGNIASDGENFLYLVRGSNFVRLDPASSAATSLAPPPFSFERWGGLRHLDGVLYGHQGNGTTGFASYDIGTDQWTLLPPLPAGTVLGAAIDPINRAYVAYGSYIGRNLYRYSIPFETWNVSTIPFFRLNDGGMGWLPEPVRGIYFVQGEQGTGFARWIPPPSFVSVDPVSGSVPPSGSLGVNVLFDTTGFPPDLYTGEIDISTNDPVTPRVAVPVQITVLPAPNIAVSGDPFDFGTLYVDTERDLPFLIENRGTGLLQISSISSDTPVFSPSATILSLPPGASETVTITMRPSSAASFQGVLSITSNDPDTPVVRVSLLGIAEGPPVLELDPVSLDAALLPGKQEVLNLTISNAGRSPLDFSLTVAPSGTTFMRLIPIADTVPDSGSVVVRVVLDTTGLPPGLHEAGILVSSNDPARPLVTVPVHLTVLDAPDIPENS